MKNLSQIRKKREDILTDWTVGDITGNWAPERVACIAAFLDELAYKDWQKWDPARQKLWDVLNELDKLGY